jgi:quercetin dioxygenase-like cupin family protein
LLQVTVEIWGSHRTATGRLLLTNVAPGSPEPGDGTHGVPLLAISVEETVGLWQEWPLTKTPTVNPDADPVIIPALAEVALQPSQPVIYDRPVSLQLLYQDRESGAEHYLVRYPAGLRAAHHTHSAAHTMVVLEGHLLANGQRVGPSGYVHFPAGSVMHHAPSEDEDCVFVVIFHGPYDVHPAQEPAENPGPPSRR